MTQSPPDTNASRFTWEAFIRGARLGNVIPAQGKRGAVSATAFKAVALTWASYADPDGSKVFPGVATVAVAAEVSFKTAKLVTSKLVELGLLKRVAPSTRRARRFDLYRLAIPADILEHVVHLDPDQMTKAGEAMRLAYRGKPSDSVGVPVDPLPEVDDEPESDPDPEIGGVSGGPPDLLGVGSGGPAVGGPVDCGTYQETVPLKETRPYADEDVDLTVTVESAHQDRLISQFARPEPTPTCGRRNCRKGFVKIGINDVRCHICPLPASAES